MQEAINEIEYSKTFQESKKESEKLESEIIKNPSFYKVLTGDRPTGRLHIGHYFGSLKNRVKLASLGIPTMIVIADYQVLTDHSAFDKISQNIKELVLDYLSAGIVPSEKVNIFPHSYIPEENQLLLPFLTLVTTSELDRNPTVKEEIQNSSMKSINAGMFVYPIHQAVDILFCKANVIPVGKDQLPHIELTRTIAKRFNKKYFSNSDKNEKKEIFPLPKALLSKTPSILGLDGTHKMSKSLNNAIMLSDSEDDTAKAIKKAVTDTNRNITFDVVNRPAVSNLLTLISLCTNEAPEDIAQRIGDKGARKLKEELTIAINETLRPIREKRRLFEKNMDYVKEVLNKGVEAARKEAIKTLDEVRRCMNMVI